MAGDAGWFLCDADAIGFEGPVAAVYGVKELRRARRQGVRERRTEEARRLCFAARVRPAAGGGRDPCVQDRAGAGGEEAAGGAREERREDAAALRT